MDIAWQVSINGDSKTPIKVQKIIFDCFTTMAFNYFALNVTYDGHSRLPRTHDIY